MQRGSYKWECDRCSALTSNVTFERSGWKHIQGLTGTFDYCGRCAPPVIKKEKNDTLVNPL